MKIAQVVCVYPPYKGGIGNVAMHYTQELRKLGHSVDIITPQYQTSSTIINKDIKYIKPLVRLGNGAFIPSIFFELKKYDAVHLHYPFFGGIEPVWLAKFLHRKKFKLITHYHMDVLGLSILAKILSVPSKIIIRSLFNISDAISCASIDYVKYSSISKFYNKHKDKFYEIPFGVNFDKFYPSTDNSFENKINALFVGGLDKAHYFKGLNVLIESLVSVNENVFLNIVGDGGMRSDYEKIVDKLELNNRVKFLGILDNENLTKVYREADFFVLPSINKGEAYGLVLLEAMASGLPVIASNLPGVRSVFNENEQGYLADPNNSRDLAEKINALAIDQEKRREMSLSARKHVLKNNNWELAGKKLDNIFKSIKL